MIQVYGIPNCDTVKKAMLWLKQHAVEYEFHDFKKEGVKPEKLKEWLNISSLEKLLNKKSMAFKKLSEEDKLKTATKNEVINLMVDNTNMIKRPVTEIAGTVLHGFDEHEFYQAFIKK